MNRKQLTLIALMTLPWTAGANDTAALLAPAFEAADDRKFEHAIDTLTSLAKSHDNPAFQFHLARIQHRAGEYEKASDTIDALIEAYPDHSDAHYLAGLINLSMIGEVNIFKKVGVAKRALGAWKQAASIDPEHLDARYAIFAFYANAPGIAGGDIDKARKLALELEQRDPGYGAMARGLLATRAEAFDEAETALQDAARLLDRAGPHFVLAQFYASREQWEPALAEIERYLQKEKRWWDPDITVIHLTRARVYAATGDVGAARREAERGLGLSPPGQIRELLKDFLQTL